MLSSATSTPSLPTLLPQGQAGSDGSSSSRVVAYSSQQSSYSVSLGNGQSGAYTYTSLSQSYRFSSVTSPDSVDQTVSTGKANESGAVTDSSPLLEGARTILQFVESRIAAEKAAGASEEELAELWEQGLKGFVQGYTDAFDMLQGTGQLGGEVLNSVQTLADQVYKGFDDLYARYVGVEEGVDAPSAASYGPPPVEVNQAEPKKLFSLPINTSDTTLQESLDIFGENNKNPLSAFVDSLNDMTESMVEYGRKDSFSFQLMTVDGDKVTIKASQTMAFYGEYSDRAVAEGMKQKGAYTFDVKGDLDEQELAAINDLMGQVMSLADDFYNGDIDKAYEAALEVGYNQNEIASYAINLRQTQTFSVAAVYQTETPALGADLKDALHRIGEFAEKVLSALSQPENNRFFDYTALLLGISEQIDQQVTETSSQRFRDVLEQLVEVSQ